jgi:hypothetical protein
MAGRRKRRPLWDYIFLDKKTPWKPEILRIAATVGLSRREVWATLCEFWIWVDDNCPDGLIWGANVPFLSRIGPDTGDAFWHSCAAVGWITVCAEGVRVPNFDRWLGDTAKKRSQEALRKWNYRQGLPENGAEPRDNRGTTAGQNGDIVAPLGGKKRREEKRVLGDESPKNPSCPEADGPPSGPPPLLVFPTVGKDKQWPLTEAKLQELAAAFPALDVLGECRKALAWVQQSPDRRKTAKGMGRFLFGWAERAQNRGAAAPAAANGRKPEQTIEELVEAAAKAKEERDAKRRAAP